MNTTGKSGIGAWVEEEERFSMNVQPTTLNVRSIRISLRQWRMFHAVVESNGYMEAAEKLHISQSSISHALAKLQQQLGLPLLTLKGRKAQITEEGKILLERSRQLLKFAVDIEELAENLLLGWGPEIRVMTDPDFPAELMTRSLHEFSTSARNIRLTVQEASTERAQQALLDNTVDFAICDTTAPGYVNRELLGVEYVPVAHPGNPLFALKRSLTVEDLKTQPEITVSGCDDYLVGARGRSLPQSISPWKVSSIERAVEALYGNSGYAWLPKYKLSPWLDKENLRHLPLETNSSHSKNLYLINGAGVRNNPYASRFGDVLHSVARVPFDQGDGSCRR